MLTRQWAVCVAGIAAVGALMTGCGIGGSYQATGTKAQDAALTTTIQQYLTIRAQHNWSAIGPYLTGDALSALQTSIPSIQKAGATDTLSSVQVTPKWVSPDGTLAVVEAQYELTRSVANTGTSVDAVATVYNLSYLSGRWRIYNTSTVLTTPQP